jgi:ABC-type Fe3+/spermidine/putrescine transport system ATPase subunit
MTTLALLGLTKRYGTTVAVEDLSLEVGSGELLALLGPSGCGKTTTMRLIAGLLDPTAGDIRFNGRSMLATSPERRGAVMVFQKHLLFPHMSVGENVAFGLKMRGVDKTSAAAKARAMLDLVQLEGMERRRPHELSGGQQQRVALARALVVEPQVLLLDEPLANLDANLRLEMRKLIRSVQQQTGITTLFVTHDQEEAVMLADRVALLMGGRLQQVGTPRDLYARPSSVRVARFFRNENFLAASKLGCRLQTSVGELVIPTESPLPDGAVVVTVRPEHIVPCSGSHDEEGHAGQNCLAATVVSSVYMGAATQVQLALGEDAAGPTWWAAFGPEAACAVGQKLRVHLPPAHLWLLPGDRDGEPDQTGTPRRA